MFIFSEIQASFDMSISIVPQLYLFYLLKAHIVISKMKIYLFGRNLKVDEIDKGDNANLERMGLVDNILQW